MSERDTYNRVMSNPDHSNSAVGMSGSIGILPGGYFARLLSGEVDRREIMKGTNKTAPRAANAGATANRSVVLMHADRTNDGLILRTARKRWECRGDGRATNPQHSPDCPRVIEPGDQYVECLWESPAYASGTRHTIVCATETHGYVASDEEQQP
jgi:hypothetical protein